MKNRLVLKFILALINKLCKAYEGLNLDFIEVFLLSGRQAEAR